MSHSNGKEIVWNERTQKKKSKHNEATLQRPIGKSSIEKILQTVRRKVDSIDKWEGPISRVVISWIEYIKRGKKNLTVLKFKYEGGGWFSYHITCVYICKKRFKYLTIIKRCRRRKDRDTYTKSKKGLGKLLFYVCSTIK